MCTPISLDEAEARIHEFCDLRILTLPKQNGQIRAIFGSPATESSFKSILGLGLLLLARREGLLAPGQPVIESTSGSLGVGLAYAGKLLGHRVHLISDIGIPKITLRKLDHLQAVIHLVSIPHPSLGMQQSRDDLLTEILSTNSDYYWPNQNDSPLNPEVYRRWLVPRLRLKLHGSAPIDAGCFAVGSGGHFTALAEMLRKHGAPSYAADREGSITFGGSPGSSVIRGVGDQNRVPAVIQNSMNLVQEAIRVKDCEAISSCRRLAKHVYLLVAPRELRTVHP
ncbi:pyridoxal-phosphate dependent enzyme [Actinomyces wuliandei]|uniref:pyridoxal-phosphate dependent enzyme n=1 Tax=Actinomyces wuliandei TaxID=2057743 RepID=UPI001C59F85E